MTTVGLQWREGARAGRRAWGTGSGTGGGRGRVRHGCRAPAQSAAGRVSRGRGVDGET